ncbi:unnamed protein product [Calypogeia fissa]
MERERGCSTSMEKPREEPQEEPAAKSQSGGELTAKRSGLHTSVESVVSELWFLPSDAVFQGPEETEHESEVLKHVLETRMSEPFPESCDSHCLSETIMVHITTCPLFKNKRIQEGENIAGEMAGHAFFQEREKSGSSFLPLLFLNLHATLQEISKWLYGYLKAQGRRLAKHPQHVRDIPRKWRHKTGEVYPADENVKEIAGDNGLSAQQVRDLFANERKRHVKRNEPGLKATLKAHFSKEITEKLRKYQTDIGGGKSKEDSKARDALLTETGLSRKQLDWWMTNHAVGRRRW